MTRFLTARGCTCDNVNVTQPRGLDVFRRCHVVVEASPLSNLPVLTSTKDNLRILRNNYVTQILRQHTRPSYSPQHCCGTPGFISLYVHFLACRDKYIQAYGRFRPFSTDTYTDGSRYETMDSDHPPQSVFWHLPSDVQLPGPGRSIPRCRSLILRPQSPQMISAFKF
ncbi:hypothetical protein K439DRAFT_169073 [Ramaria rubella]|nr:hypothetical protein K439DRAFT_169073 [Ramaria rubella]